MGTYRLPVYTAPPPATFERMLITPAAMVADGGVILTGAIVVGSVIVLTDGAAGNIIFPGSNNEFEIKP